MAETAATTKDVTKAVIPAAGLGTRFLPATKATPKEMLPVVDKPAIQYVVEEAVAADRHDVLMITSRSKVSIENHFDRAYELEEALVASLRAARANPAGSPMMRTRTSPCAFAAAWSIVRVAATLPSRRTTTESHVRATSSSTCDDMMTAMPRMVAVNSSWPAPAKASDSRLAKTAITAAPNMPAATPPPTQ